MIFAFSFISGCGPSQQEYEEARQRAAELETEVTALRAELEDIKFGAKRLFAQATLAYEADNDSEAKTLLLDLIQRHPSSSESKEASLLLTKVESRIIAAEQQRKREEEQRAKKDRQALAQALGNMKTTKDEIKGITWIGHKKAPILTRYISAYFGAKNESTTNYPLRLKLQYYGDDWLFVRSVTIKADEKIYELGRLSFERDHSSGSVWEWIDMPVKDHQMLTALMTAKKVIIRFDGKQYYDDFLVPKEQQAQLREVYDVWKSMGGTP